MVQEEPGRGRYRVTDAARYALLAIPHTEYSKRRLNDPAADGEWDRAKPSSWRWPGDSSAGQSLTASKVLN